MRYLSLVLISLLVFGGALVVGAQDVVRNSPVSVECGSIIEDVFNTSREEKLYTLNLEPGAAVNATVTPLGAGLSTALLITSPTNFVVAGSDETEFDESDARVSMWRVLISNPTAATERLSAGGDYNIRVVNFNSQFYYIESDNYSFPDDSGGSGVFTLFVGCTLRDGTVIEPGSAVPANNDSEDTGGSGNIVGNMLGSAANQAANVPAAPDFSGFGFPGVAPRDFSAGIELPLTAGTPQLAPIANDVALYTYVASAGETRTLSISRASGDLSIGVTVIRQDTNEILFLGGMPASNNLSVEVTFPADATYVIGLFRLDTAERSGTSGAVQVSLE